MASARTSDHHPIPIQATRSGLALTTLPSPRPRSSAGFSPCYPSFPTRADLLAGHLGDTQIGFPITPAHADTADIIVRHRNASFKKQYATGRQRLSRSCGANMERSEVFVPMGCRPNAAQIWCAVI